MPDIEVLDLIDLGRSMPPDTDRPITTDLKGDALVIRLEQPRICIRGL